VKFHAHATAGNLNNHIGVPLTLLQLKPEHEIAIIEMGANHQGEIEMLCSIAEPDYGIVTNIGKAHLEGFGGVEGVIKAKSEMFDFIKKRNGKLFVNADDSLLMEKSEQGKRILYGTTQESHLRGRKEKSLPELSFSFTWKREETLIKSKTVQSHLSGDFHMSNLLCAAAVGAYFGLSADEIKSGIESYQPKNQRSQWVEIGSTKILLDTYNANPGSVSAAIKLLNELPNDGKKLAVLGDMFELGKDSRDEHLAILKQISSSVEISALVLGEEFFNAYQEQPDAFKNILPFRDREALFDYIKKTDRENLTVLLKGSRGMKMEDFLAAFH
jgi:UDP-N-acetylmuramoyl-tripeptide--D-alanyl-D-alanine ligase